MLRLFKVREKLQTNFSNPDDANKGPVSKKVAIFPALDGFNPNERA